MKNTSDNYDGIISRLLLAFPDFSNSAERREVYDNDGPYIYMQYFMNYLLDRRKKGNSEILLQALEFVNNLFEEENMSSKTWDLFNIEFFDRIKEDQGMTTQAKLHLKGKALNAFVHLAGRPTEDQ